MTTKRTYARPHGPIAKDYDRTSCPQGPRSAYRERGEQQPVAVAASCPRAAAGKTCRCRICNAGVTLPKRR